jgi:hypothetical protein
MLQQGHAAGSRDILNGWILPGQTLYIQWHQIYLDHQYASFFISTYHICLRMTQISGKCCRENQNTHFMFNNFFPPKSCCLSDYMKSYNTESGPGSSVDIVTGYCLDGPGIESQWRRDFSLLSRPTLGPTKPPVQWVPGLSRGVKSGRGVTLSPHFILVPLVTKE